MSIGRQLPLLPLRCRKLLPTACMMPRLATVRQSDRQLFVFPNKAWEPNQTIQLIWKAHFYFYIYDTVYLVVYSVCCLISPISILYYFPGLISWKKVVVLIGWWFYGRRRKKESLLEPDISVVSISPQCQTGKSYHLFYPTLFTTYYFV